MAVIYTTLLRKRAHKMQIIWATSVLYFLAMTYIVIMNLYGVHGYVSFVEPERQLCWSVLERIGARIGAHVRIPPESKIHSYAICCGDTRGSMQRKAPG
jgi:hypothetical protein